jgi:serine/threonine protein kinase
MSESGVKPGDVLAGKYRVERVLGEGGMGIVVAARHLQLDEMVALKFLLPEALGNPASIARFIREGRAAVKIKSEHVARVSDVGQLENGAPYLVMEYLDGGDLDAWLRQRGALPVEQAVEFVLQACVAVAEAHALGIVHRDLKPANLFCVRRSDGQLAIKVLDFGISKLTDASASGPAMTRTSAVMGSPLYMSPEQMQSSKRVDARTDLWALGVVLYELITGRSPFLAESVMELAVKIANEPPPPLRSLRPEAPAGLEGAIVKCLQKNPAERYANVGELAQALAPFAPLRARSSVERITGIVQSSKQSQPEVVRMPAASEPANPSNPDRGTLSMARTTLGGGRAKSAVIGAALAVLALAVVVGAVVAVSRRTASIPTQASLAVQTSLPAPVPSDSSSGAPPITPPIAASAAIVPSTAIPASSPAAASPPNPATHPLIRPSAASPPHNKPSAPVDSASSTCDPPYTINAAGHRVHKPECP